MKGEVGSCCPRPLSPSKRWETIKRRPESLPASATATELLTKVGDRFPNASAKKREEARQAQVRHIIAILHKWGIHTLGQFAALEKEQVSLRLGPEAVRMWERANGTSTRLLKLIEPPESFADSFEFENEIETTEPLLFMLRRFLQQLSLRLGALYFVAKELKLRITFSDKNCYEHLFKIPEPSTNVEVLFRMLHTHLENFTSPAPIIAVSLEAEPTKPGQQQFGLFETALRDPMQLSETLARLTGLLGAERVGTPVLEETHRPDVFGWSRFRGSWTIARRTSRRCHCSRCAAFVQRRMHQYCSRMTSLCMCKAPKRAAKSRSRKVPTSRQETGGMKKPGREPNGICSSRMARCAAVTSIRRAGRWMGFTISSGAHASWLTSSCMPAARSASCAADRFLSK
jgi:nucleotidyltransferase/DNA polymerase involved in DNA repair